MTNYECIYVYLYEGCLLYFGTKTNINHWKSLYCFSKYSPLRSIHFCMRLNQLPKHFCHSDWGIYKICTLNASTASSGVEKRTGIKRSHSVPSQDYIVDDSSNRCFECSKMQLFEPMCESSHCRGKEWSVFGGWFSWFLGRQLANKWLCTI